MLNSAVIHFFCADKTQFELLNVDAAEKKISMANDNIVKSAECRIIRLLVNSKSLNK